MDRLNKKDKAMEGTAKAIKAAKDKEKRKKKGHLM